MVKFINYKNKKYPVRISYRALNGFKEETGKGFSEMGENMDLSNYEPLLFHSLISGALAEEVTMAFKREDMPEVLDECMMEFVGFVPDFFPDNKAGKTAGEPRPSRRERRKVDKKGNKKK